MAAKNTFDAPILKFGVSSTAFTIHGYGNPNFVADVEAPCGQNTAHFVSTSVQTPADLKTLKQLLLKALSELEAL